MKLNQTVKKVAFYLRVSTDEQVEGYGIPAQKETLLALIKAKGLTDFGENLYKYAGGIDEKGNPIDTQYIYIDPGESGTKPMMARPAFRQLVDDYDNAPDDDKPFNVVAVYKIDRFARRLKVLLEIIDFFDSRGIEFISANESIDTSNPFGKAILGIIGVIAELEMENIRIRTTDGKLKAQKEGVFMGKHPPYGYTTDSDGYLIKQKEESERVEEVFELYNNKDYTFQAIANVFTERKYLSPSASAEKHGKSKGVSNRINAPWFWSMPQIKRILKDKIYTGEYYYNVTTKDKKKRVELSDRRHEQTVDLYLFNATQQKILREEKNRKNIGMKSDHTYLLRGLLKCANCYDPYVDEHPHNMIGDRKKIGENKYSFYYKCKRKWTRYSDISCNVLPMSAQKIEEYIVDLLKKVVTNPRDVFEYQLNTPSKELERVKLKKRLKTLTQLINGYSSAKEHILLQHEKGWINQKEAERKLDELAKANKAHNDEFMSIQQELGEISLSTAYEKVFATFKEKYTQAIENTFNDRDELKRLIDMVVDEIIIFSRPLTDKDIVAGKRKPGQVKPYKMKIVMRLPKEMLIDLAKYFEVDVSEWWVM